MSNSSKVFISSTSEDLEPYREAAKKAAITAGFLPIMFEDWAAGGNPPLQECLDRAEPTDLLVVMVTKRYGWVPEGGTKSITRLECEQAVRQGIQILPFILDDKTDWPARFDESHRQGIPEAYEKRQLPADPGRPGRVAGLHAYRRPNSLPSP